MDALDCHLDRHLDHHLDRQRGRIFDMSVPSSSFVAGPVDCSVDLKLLSESCHLLQSLFSAKSKLNNSTPDKTRKSCEAHQENVYQQTLLCVALRHEGP